jgi:hypothetical protein
MALLTQTTLQRTHRQEFRRRTGKESYHYQQRREGIHAVHRKDLQENKMLLHPILPGGSNLDTPSASVLLSPPVPQGKINNQGNLKQAGWQCNIPDPLLLLIQEITNRLEACRKEGVDYMSHF